jgi:hypothetical protein
MGGHARLPALGAAARLCWPLDLAVLVLYPLVWLLLLPIRIVGIAVDGVLATLRAILFLSARLLGAGHGKGALGGR